MAHRAVEKGDLRLGVSRAISAVIQASIVGALSRNRSVKLYADDVIQGAREIVMGIVVGRAAVRKMRKLG